MSRWSRSTPYRKKNKAKLLGRDEIKRAEVKINPEKNKARLLKERLYKPDNRKRMKKNNQDQ